jgi:UDP-2,3-diacylglucosamine hydrolase
MAETNAGQPNALGIIAGNRTLPLALAREARAAGISRLVAVAFENETDPALAGLVDEIVWLKVGQLTKLIEAFGKRGVSQCVMVGQIAPRNLFDLRPDLRAMGMLLRLKEKNAHTVFGAIADELQKEGIQLIPALPWLKSQMPGAGFRIGKLSDAQAADVAFGHQIAKETSRLEIGQTVVVKDGTVLAVEAFEGTDRCLQRGGELAGPKGGATAVKVAKANHDLRFARPTVGPKTVEVCANAGIDVLAFEPDITILLERTEVEALCQKHKVTLATVSK